MFDIVIPDGIEPIRAFRAWKVTGGADEPRLSSVTHGEHTWNPREATSAECDRCGPSGTPGKHCSCGLYAAKSLGHLASMNYEKYRGDGFVACGEVALWGRVVPGTQGYRAQLGYPKVLYLPFEAWRYAKGLKDAYGVAVELDNTLAYDEEEVR